jgi:hypothetical protein
MKKLTMKGTKIMTDKSKAPASELFDQALKNYEQALRAGLKIQEDAGAYWTKLFNQAAVRPDFQKQITSLANDTIPPTQKYMEGCLELLEQNSRASVELMKKSMEAVQTPNLAESQGKLMDFCESSLKSVKANAQAVVDMNSKAIDSWMSVVRKATADVVESKAEKA